MAIYPTACCALCQLSYDNTVSINVIRYDLNILKSNSKHTYKVGDSSGYGQKAVFVITTPTELELEKKLIKVGYKQIHTFERRNGYPKGLLKMWIYNF